MNTRLASKVALVTSATQGIGAAIARSLIQAGCFVYVTDINDELGASFANSLGSAALFGSPPTPTVLLRQPNGVLLKERTWPPTPTNTPPIKSQRNSLSRQAICRPAPSSRPCHRSHSSRNLVQTTLAKSRMKMQTPWVNRLGCEHTGTLRSPPLAGFFACVRSTRQAGSGLIKCRAGEKATYENHSASLLATLRLEPAHAGIDHLLRPMLEQRPQ
ncbi:SDR family NAD(P)-dependent oxidoreductase [Acidovorax sp. LjRoot129]|uniref:SDR family NAD(P)-dependent oxidoreductase n=1 Tax=Acidovorax sp. LjRoot129 TaxID=3342260 RepID=UPI003ECFF1C3